MIDLKDLNPNEFPGTPGSLLAALLELAMYSNATQQIIIRNQAKLAAKLDPTIDEDYYIDKSQDETLEYYNELKAMIYAKS